MWKYNWVKTFYVISESLREAYLVLFLTFSKQFVFHTCNYTNQGFLNKQNETGKKQEKYLIEGGDRLGNVVFRFILLVPNEF